MSKTNINIEELKKQALVLDIECWSDYDINRENEQYLEDAKIRVIGYYSYTEGEYKVIKVKGNEEKIRNLIANHKYLVTFNGDAFDIPILKNTINNLWPMDAYIISVDLKKILAPGLGNKNRGILMGYKFPANSLKAMAETMGLDVAKGSIDHAVWKLDHWSVEQIKKIIEYTKRDIEVTKAMFDKVWEFWLPFTEWISEKNVHNLSWIKSSSGALSYKVTCEYTKLPEIYGDKPDGKEDVGGLVATPAGEEFTDVWYWDYASLYPHIFMMFNLFGNPTLVPNMIKPFSGNNVFHIEGVYESSEPHFLAKKMQEMYNRRKKTPKSESLNYALKIQMNSTYGLFRSPVFASTYYEHTGADCCRIGQRMNTLITEFFENVGFMLIASDTDSNFLKYVGDEPLTIEEQYELALETKNQLLKFINAHVPFPSTTFDLDSETGKEPIKWIGFNKDTNGTFKKKNYFYICKEKGEYVVVIKGLPIKKSNATKLSKHIFEKYIKPRMIKELTGRFEPKWIAECIKKELVENLKLMAQEYKTKPVSTYKDEGCINAQISKAYLNSRGGPIKLIKNNHIGKVGKQYKYCTLEEAHAQGLKYTDIDLTKLYKELRPFATGPIDVRALQNASLGDFW